MNEASRDGGTIGRDDFVKDVIARVLFFVALVVNIYCLVRWIKQPLLDQFYFRQTQTALSTYWLEHTPGLAHWLNYETPILGSPWQIPMEFPLFQWIVALAHMATGIPLDPLGRCISGILFYCCLWPLSMLVRDLGFNRRLFYVSAALLLFSPIYIYWSRAFLIESTALFFSLLYLAWLNRYLVHRKRSHIILATIAGVLGILVKVTTFAAFGVAGGALVVADIYVTGRWKSVAQLLKYYLPTLLCMVVCFICLEWWLKRSDAIKSVDVIGSMLTSKSLDTWNFGTLSQRMSLQLWKDTVWKRTIPESIGSTFVLLIWIAALIQARSGRIRVLILLPAALFILPFLLFTNLYIVHSYYAYGNGVFLVLALSIALWSLAERAPAWLFACLCVLMALAELNTFYTNYHLAISVRHRKDDPILTGEFIRNNTGPLATILVVGNDWSPEVAYYSQRRAIYLPGWVSGSILESIKKEPEKLTYNGLPIAAVVEHDQVKESDSRKWADQLAAGLPAHSFGAYHV
ncbi:MAG: hypothetical protein WCD79_07265, partial [Chthoniobacteraceae bacterium]